MNSRICGIKKASIVDRFQAWIISIIFQPLDFYLGSIFIEIPILLVYKQPFRIQYT